MKKGLVFLCSLSCVAGGLVAAPAAPPQKAIAFINGLWFNGVAFERKTAYSVNGRLTFRPVPRVDQTVDLRGGFVVPPFGEAHNHNVETLNRLEPLIARYLQHGIYYVKNPNSLARDRPVLAPKLNLPSSIDVVFANGGLTGSKGHPAEIPQRVIGTGRWTEADAEGGFYYTIDSPVDLDQKWPALVATKPDFIKTYLLYSEQYRKRKDDPRFEFWRGLDPALLPLIVKRAHAAGLRVSTHIESAADFHNALFAGVDEINHMPGFRFGTDVEPHAPEEFLISETDARRAAKSGTFVVTTLMGATRQTDANLKRAQDAINSKNLALLVRHHVKIALGSDSYRDDTLPEALYIASLRVIDNRTLLNIWCTTTAETIFPHRRIGHLQEGYEASFLVLPRNPLDDFTAVEQIVFKFKQGQIL